MNKALKAFEGNNELALKLQLMKDYKMIKTSFFNNLRPLTVFYDSDINN